jgi:hypothetical protein
LSEAENRTGSRPVGWPPPSRPKASTLSTGTTLSINSTEAPKSALLITPPVSEQGLPRGKQPARSASRVALLA